MERTLGGIGFRSLQKPGSIPLGIGLGGDGDEQ